MTKRISDDDLHDVIEAVEDQSKDFPATDLIHTELAALRELQEWRRKRRKSKREDASHA